jgi:hypothetical protein
MEDFECRFGCGCLLDLAGDEPPGYRRIGDERTANSDEVEFLSRKGLDHPARRSEAACDHDRHAGDGADDVRELPLYLSPESEHWLDWFHVAMRLRVMGQMAKGLVNEQNMTSAQESLTEAGEELDTVDIGKQLERVKWFLWHGNVVRALDTMEDI